VWHLKGIRRETDEGRCILCLGEDDDIKPILFDCLETRKWGMKFLSKKWLSMNTEVAYRKIVRCPNKNQIRNLGGYLDKVKYKWFYKTK
jgi:hypothetical protein